ncbi:hypothetical protein CQA53_01630 [Helicobacter didelphidarum]|uniref:G domain-containing protein n=1 Tax=Helicobacter didelphidarum TaxID=2040648 RepID=A0A3D8IPS7_9HELI|nr:hypothetical protein [Helicobacter didelphidarum]RDU66990.1 hypothetical protein CQA53_01630 [Helicobacter didelphidarum]
MPLPWIVGGIAVAGGLAALYSWLSDDDDKNTDQNTTRKPTKDTLLLLGETAAGKDTLIHILAGKVFANDYTATATHDRTGVHINNLLVHNTSGSTMEAVLRSKEELKDELQRYKDKVFLAYVFNADEYKTNKKIHYGIGNCINETKGRGFKRCLAIGTRGDKILAGEKTKIENEIRQRGLECSIFDMTKSPKNEIKDFIQKVVKQ